MEGQTQKSFHRLVFITRDELLAARWWHEGMEASVAASLAPSRRKALKVLLAMGGVVGGGLLLRAGCKALGEHEITADALELQRKEGWAVGAAGKPLVIPHAVAVDSQGASNWALALPQLAEDLSPGGRLEPFYLPTLFEILKNPRGAGFSASLLPMHSASMESAEMAGRALAALFANDEQDQKGTALILDMPGPEAVAAAVGVSRVFAPVFLFDNWPHPLGVVPSHESLAAALYHRPDLLSAREARPPDAAPAFVLDNRRLSPYRDESDRFDNRYLARVPSAEALSGLGIRRILYVTEVAQPHEEDDLNDDFVALGQKGIQVKLIALSDFAPASAGVLTDNGLPVSNHSYYYGGHPHGYLWFWSSYGYSHGSLARSRTTSTPLPRPVSTGGNFQPAARPTMFSSRSLGGLGGVGKQKPSGFGRVSYRAGSDGSFRSGSFGRSRSGGFG
jgi:hypothetical protein